MMHEKEIWKRLIYQGEDYGNFYEISNYGEIRNSKTHKIRKKNISKTGYYFVSGSLGSKDDKITFKNHKALAETFIPNPNNLPIINHIDGNKLNNDIDNLEWCTHSENVKHALDHNLFYIHKGINNCRAKLTNEIVEYIRNNYVPYDNEFGTRGLARKFDIDHKTIIRILQNKAYMV